MRFQQYSAQHNVSLLPAFAAVSLIAAVMVLTIMSSDVRADSECEVVAGVMTGQLLPPSACPISPVGICSIAVVTGDLEGDYEFTVDSSTATGNMTFFTGGTVFELEDGDILFTTDLVQINTGNGDAVHSFTILGGTGEFEGAMGQQIILSAIVDSDAGTFDGTYDGVLCIPDDDDDDDDDD